MNNDANKFETNEQKMLMSVVFDQIKNTYYVNLAKGSNVAETAFAMTIVIKCLVKDGLVKDSKEVTDLIEKYLNDPQYDELKEDDSQEEQQ